jgi:hypothetical protein
LLQIKPDIYINISVHNEYAFRNACAKGHLHVAQWLLQVKPDINISANNKEAFHYAKKNGYLDVYEWLQSLLLPSGRLWRSFFKK